MSLIYLLSPALEVKKYIYNASDLRKRIEKNKLRPGNERVIPKANSKNIKFGRWKNCEDSFKRRYEVIFDKIKYKILFRSNDWSLIQDIESKMKGEYLNNYIRLINTIEWIDDDSAKFDQIYDLLNERIKRFG